MLAMFKHRPLLIWLLVFVIVCTPLMITPKWVSAASNLALNKSVTESGHIQNYAAANATDGNQATYWEGPANQYPNWLRVDLGSTQSVNQVVLKLPASWGTRTQTLSVQSSIDGTSFVDVVGSATYTFSSGTNTVTIPFTAANARYVTINFTTNSGATGGQASELEVYGPTPTATPSPSPTPAPSATAPPNTISAFNQTAAASFSSQLGIQTEASSEGGQNVGFIDNGDYLLFNNVHFGTGAASAEFRVASNASGGQIEIRVGGVNGTLAGTCAVPGTGGWQSWTTVNCGVSGLSGIHNLYLKFTGGAGNLFNVRWFKFSTAALTGDVVGKIFAGYQGWFTAIGDNSPLNNWNHWSKNPSAPGPNGNVNFELYPDTREYSKLYQTALGNLGNGQQAKLFSSYDQETVNKHFEWMQTYNINGAALQRFGAKVNNSSPDSWMINRDSVAVKVKNAAEAYNRKFYIMYDITGLDASTWVTAVKNDFVDNVINNMNLTASSAYAKQEGKPVVNIWGIGFDDRPGTAAECTELITWFQNQGYYVIGGVPTYWRTEDRDSKPAFLPVYKKLDMISPWFVARFGTIPGADDFKTNQWQPDYNLTQQNGIDYQPVIWPGSAWSNMTGGPRNENPRLHGDFMWRQAYNMKSIGIRTGYIAMFDEYDEGTAIAKMAENSSMIPNNQYFLTLDADGVAVSSDFYLRLAGDINRMFNDEIPITANHPTSHQ
ncbi:carbohydrate-binding protein [Paenibacillus sinopodophylli]|uniref:carbohydrate-binding protein n=1 Tax=Paenibacillus sinopodophylli TaxID=1837342 RepID=UPI001FE7BE3D|nr:carbohydrate-binding protein [Paenibacillus sinopodophylli]